jgi:hypothetical protein
MATWNLDTIPWHLFNPDKVDPTFLALAKSAALVEYNSSEYGRYLCQVFATDFSLCSEINRWSKEEEQHGQALRKWCELADVDFNFDEAFSKFSGKIQLPNGSQGSVRGSGTGELLARCVVECGTSMFYSCLSDQVEEPVLKYICTLIARDEFNHYRLFFTHSRRWMAKDPLSILARLKVVFGRMIESEDDELAYAWYCSNLDSSPYRRRAVLRQYLLASLSVLRSGHMERSLNMVMRAAGLTGSKRAMQTMTMLAMRVVHWRIKRLASRRSQVRLARAMAPAIKDSPITPLWQHSLTA